MNLKTAYEYYFTASDVKIFISNPDTGKLMHLDKTVGIGYSGDVSSVPIYTVGSSIPAFFSKGNFLGQGMLVLPFFDERYFKTALQYVFNEMPTSDKVSPTTSTLNPDKLSDDAFRKGMINTTSDNEDGITNISTIRTEFDIVIVLDNSTPFKDSSSKGITLKVVKLTSDSL